MQLIAKTQKGTEFMHSKANAFFVSDAGANKIYFEGVNDYVGRTMSI